jgi:hypothetical protein
VINEFKEFNVLVVEGRNIRSGKRILSFATDKDPILPALTHTVFTSIATLRTTVPAVK